MWPDPDDPACHGVPEAELPPAASGRRLIEEGDTGSWFESDDAVARQRERLNQMYPHLRQQKRVMPAGVRSGEGITATAAADAAKAGNNYRGLVNNAVRMASSMASMVHGGGSRTVARRLATGSMVCPGRGKVERAAFLPAWMSAAWSYMDVKAHDWNHSVTPPTQVNDLGHFFIMRDPAAIPYIMMSCTACPFQVFGHIIFLANEKRIYKNVLKMTYGW